MTPSLVLPEMGGVFMVKNSLEFDKLIAFWTTAAAYEGVSVIWRSSTSTLVFLTGRIATAAVVLTSDTRVVARLVTERVAIDAHEIVAFDFGSLSSTSPGEGVGGPELLEDEAVA